MLLSYELEGSKKPAKINTYRLTRAELLITLCYEIPCIIDYTFCKKRNICKMHQNLKEYNLRQPKLNCSNPNLCRKIHKVFGAFLPPSHKGYDPKLVSKELLHFQVTVWFFQQIRGFVRYTFKTFCCKNQQKCLTDCFFLCEKLF